METDVEVVQASAQGPIRAPSYTGVSGTSSWEETRFYLAQSRPDPILDKTVVGTMDEILNTYED